VNKSGRAVDDLLSSLSEGSLSEGSLSAWLAAHEGPVAYLVLALSAMLEYLVPPLPGDSIALFGVSLATSAGWSPWAVYAALNAGAISGGQIAYYAGRWFGPRHRRPRFLRGKRAERELDRVIQLFRERGAIALALNRFVPAFRSVFFVGAGIAELPALSVLGWGALSALLWNALVVGVGYALGATFGALEQGMRLYVGIALVVILVLVGVWMWRRRTKIPRSFPHADVSRSGTHENESAPGAGAPSAPSTSPDQPER
jgi:membrane protein DedA with SNARE-associated domain